MSVNKLNKVGELAVTVPGATRIFEQLGIDYCCGGGRTLEDACQKVNLPVSQVLERLATAAYAINPGDKLRDWQAESLTSLSAYIVNKHHLFTRQELARLETLADKVCLKHAENHPELIELRKVFEHLKQELIPHMLKEEQVLFPFIERMEKAISEGRSVMPPFFITVRNPVRMMTEEHDRAGELLVELRRITEGYTLPPNACASFQALYHALPELEADLHVHIHLENNILFPRAVEMENAGEPDGEAGVCGYGEHYCLGS
jgi:regulator of cell morphogenesis and NO signaling